MEIEYKKIDGNYLEGGGQILRISMVLSSLLNIPVEINNIRAGRPRPGLSSQHLECLHLVKKITNGTLTGAKIGSTTIRFIPKKITPGTYYVDTKTAGSITLILQTIIPILLYAESSSFIELRGGTHVPFAPFVDYFTEILPAYLPFLKNTDIKCKNFGFYPKGNGLVTCRIEPLNSLTIPKIECVNFGQIKNITGSILISKRISNDIMDRNFHQARKIINSKQNVQFDVDFKKFSDNTSDGMAFMLIAHTTNDCRLSASILSERNDYQSDRYGRLVAEELINQIEHHPAVDQYLQDQLIIYMALALGHSKVLAGEITSHTKTAIWTTEQFTNVKFHVSPCTDNNNLNEIQCDGIGLKLSDII